MNPLWIQLATRQWTPSIGNANDSREREADRVADELAKGPTISENPTAAFEPLQPTAHARARDGERLDPNVLGNMNRTFGVDFDAVRVHTTADATELSEQLSARAFTLGPDIYFNSGEYQPGTGEGRRLLAHELTHVVQQTGGPAAPRSSVAAASPKITRGGGMAVQRQLAPSAIHGQHTSGGLGDLTADLSSPVTVGRAVRLETNFGYVPGYIAPSGPPVINGFPYRWTVTDRSSGAQVARTHTIDRFASIAYPRAGQFRIECAQMSASGSAAASVSMDQDAVDPDAWLASNQSQSSIGNAALAELVHDFRQYVIDSATSTGANGVTALFVVAVLSMEIENTGLFPGSNNKDARASEIDDVEQAILRRQGGATVPVSDIDHSVGVGQMKLNTLAQLEGAIPWTEQDPTNRGPARRTIRTNFDALSTIRQEQLLLRLRWPKSNIQAVAELLARLKNRSNRYPTLTRASFGSNARACQIIATEYNLGASNSAESAASPSYYGNEIWTRMSDPVLAHYFPNT